ncbi:hypothetical protein IIW_01539 [Bacillus cereus VD136]|nr:hypothetical protein IIW_01539 [Bacillus cereus VD136]EOP73493.1 hypothetical protein KOW_00903 [Bacillus cereus VDM006]
MNIQLKIITRDNWEEALKLQVSKKQTTFVPSKNNLKIGI